MSVLLTRIIFPSSFMVCFLYSGNFPKIYIIGMPAHNHVNPVNKPTTNQP